MKKVTAAALALVLVLGGCGSAAGSSTASTAESKAESAVESTVESTVESAVESKVESAAESVVESKAESVAESVAESMPEETADTVVEAAKAYFADLPEDKHMIFVPELFEKMDAGEEMLIIDIRSAEDYAEGHLKGAVNIPYATVGENAEKIPDDIQIYIHCYTGQTGSQSTVLLNVAGKKVTNIQGGWKKGIITEEGYEAYTETEAHELPEGEYKVDEKILAAVQDFYAKAPNDDHANFNFPPEELNGLIEAGDVPYTIVSVRKPEDYAAGHIAGAVNIPYGKGMQEQLAELPMDKPVIVYCYSGQSGSQTMTILRLMGYEAYNLNGGMGSAESESGWLGGGFPVVTE